MEKLNKIDIGKLPIHAREVYRILGNKVYLVGGSVRDIILGLKPKDYDFATVLRPDDVVYYFNNLNGYKVIPTGIKYGTVTVMIDDEPIEITTFRKDIKYIDGRRPDVVEFANTIEEDLSRRDFTMNAMAVDCYGNIIDPYNGRTHLEWKELHAVGNAEDRFNEDKLRVMRMFRFCAKYSLEPHKSIMYAIEVENEKSEEIEPIDITNLSVERVRDEFNKIILCDNTPFHFNRLFHFDIIQQFVPEFNDLYTSQNNPHHYTGVMGHTLNVVDKLPNKLELRLAGLFHDIGKKRVKTTDENGIDHFYRHHEESAKMCREIMTRMKYSNSEIERVCNLVYHHMIRYDKIGKKQARRFLNKVGVDLYEDLIDLMVCDRLAHNYKINELEEIFRLKFLCEQVLEEGQAVSVCDLKINGNDLIELGFKQGKIIGEILNDLKELVIDQPEMNHRGKLIEYLLFKYNTDTNSKKDVPMYTIRDWCIVNKNNNIII